MASTKSVSSVISAVERVSKGCLPSLSARDLSLLTEKSDVFDIFRLSAQGSCGPSVLDDGHGSGTTSSQVVVELGHVDVVEASAAGWLAGVKRAGQNVLCMYYYVLITAGAVKVLSPGRVARQVQVLFSRGRSFSLCSYRVAMCDC